MMATTESVKIKGAKAWLASGNIGSEKRKKPYPPILRRIAASTTEPAVGASTCAAGSKVGPGHIGSFTANEDKKASRSQRCICGGKWYASKVGISVVPACQYMAIRASSISTEPSRV